MSEKIKGAICSFLMLAVSAVSGCGGRTELLDDGPEILHQMSGPLCESPEKGLTPPQIVLGPDMTLQEMVESLVSQGNIKAALRASSDRSGCKEEVSDFVSRFIVDYMPILEKWPLFEEFRRLDAISGSYVADFISRAVLLVAENRLEDVSAALSEDVKQWKLLADDIEFETIPENPFCMGELEYLQDDFVEMPRSGLARGVRVFRCSRPEGLWFYLKDFGWIYPDESFSTRYSM